MLFFSIQRASQRALVLISALALIACDDGGGGGGTTPDVDQGSTHRDAQLDSEVIEPDSEVIEPDAEVIEPDAEVIEPDAEVIELDAEVIEPDAEVIEPDAEVIEPDAEVPACSGAAECADDDPCTEDLCEGGVCRNPAIEGCCLVDGDCADEDLCTDDRCVDHACQNIAAESCCMADRDCGVGGVCTPGGRCAAHAVAGDVRFNEIMFNPVAVDDDAGEWLELYNATGADIDLNGWGLKDNRDALYPLVVEGGALILPAGGFIVLGKSTDAATNGGISVAYAYDAALQLGNSGDQLSLFDPFGEIIDAIAYGEGWQTRPGSSLSLDPSHLDAANRDDPTMWCASLAPPLASGDRGTPGAANPSCTPPVNAVDWCRYQWPVDQASPAGTAFDAYARIFEAGMTDLTARVDANPILDVEIGYGPQGSDPASAEGWIFTAAGPNWDWDDAEEPNNDEYMASITAPSTGVYDLAARVTVDDGQSWTYCDTQAASGDGSADGYQIDNAGRLTIEASACDPNPCDEVQRACRGNTAVIYAVPGACSLIEGGFECDYGQIAEEISCGLDTCEAGECVSAGVHPAPGEVIFTEVLYDPNGLALLEENAEWFEVHNLADAPRTLNGCTIGDLAAPTSLVVEGVTLEAGGYAVFAHSLDPALNGGIDAVGVYGFGLNSGGDALFLQCDGVEISAVNFEEDAGFPNARAASIQLDPSAYTAADFSDPALWCVATAAYFTPEDGVDVHYGTPGAANPPCPQPDVEVDACSLQWPLDTEIGAGEGLTVYGVVFEAGVTDRGPNSDTDPSLVAEVGYGPVGGDPAAAEWTWFAAGINPEWSDAARPGVDEYMGEFTAPAPGAYDFAYRFKRGEGEWRYCDRAPAEGTFGSDDGYSAAEAGHLTTFASPCEADPCAQAPAPACADANTVVEYVAPGACVAEGDQARCTFDEIHSDCAINGGRCEAGACVDALPYPLMGEVVINELLYDPHLPLEDGNAEWFELVNTSDHAVTLHGCTMVDSNEGNAQPITGVNMASGAYALFGQNADISLNGGLTFDHLYSFGLNNSGDSLSIRCGDALIDHVSFIGADEGQRVALQLDPGQLDADANDNADSWCYASEVYFAAEAPEGNHLGTPGAPNPACPEIVLVDACRLYAPDSLSGAPNNPLAVVGAIFEAGVTDQTPGADAHADLRFEFGYGADMSQPSARWTWMPAVAIPDWSGAAALPGWDGYEITFNAPAVGLYSYAFRASIDAGASWLYCDGGIGSEDGYQAINAGQMTITDDVDPLCNPNPCLNPPPPTCDLSGHSVLSYSAPGVCASQTGQPTCDYPLQITDCPVLCVAGECVEGGLPPTEGEVIISELIYNPAPPLNDEQAEWIELHNTSATRLSLEGCALQDSTGINAMTFGPVQIEAGGFALVARSADPQLNGGLIPDAVFNFALNNDRDTLTLTCEGQTIDVVIYDTRGDTPIANGFSISLDPAAFTAEDNNPLYNWCRTRPIYSENNRGTPGADNPNCNVPIDWCRLQTPPDGVYAEPTVTAYGRIYQEGITDQTVGFDEDPLIFADFGIGALGSDPNDVGWVWTRAMPNLEWNGETFGEPNNDEFVVEVDAPLDGGDYNFLYRATADDGRSWTLCDRDGSDDGANAPGVMTIEGGANPCNDDPCVSLPIPAATCEGDVVVEHFAPRCEAVNGVAECIFDEMRQDCAALNMICVGAQCVEPPPAAPLAGEVIITEIMADPTLAADNLGEYIELLNRKAAPVTLQGCLLDVNGATQTLGALIIPAQTHYVLVRSTDHTQNGGVGDPATSGGLEVFMAALTVDLGNAGRPITLSCGGVEVTSLAYPPAVAGQAIQLDWRFYEGEGFGVWANWCLSTRLYNALDSGSPLVWNDACEGIVDPCEGVICDAPPADECLDAQTARIYEGVGACVPVDDQPTCEYATLEIPCGVDMACFAGQCLPTQGGEGRVVINEIDYDQPGDELTEFIELYNEGPEPVSLDGWRVNLINGSNSTVYGSVALSGLIAPNGYVIIGDEIPLPEGVPFFLFDLPNTFHELQNGAPDGVILVNLQGDAIDAVAYEGAIAGLSEGSGAPHDDGGEGVLMSIGRCPGGIDTDDNGADFRQMAPTPGEENPACGDPACAAYCVDALSHCAIYMDEAECLTACAGFATDGQPGDLIGDTRQCRQTYAAAAATDPEGSCPAAGIDGGGLCTAFGLMPQEATGLDAQLYWGRRRGPALGGQLIGLRTRGLTAEDTVISLSGMPLACVTEAEGVLCEIPAGAGRADLNFERDGVFVGYPMFYTYEEIDYCRIQWWNSRVDGNDADIQGPEGAQETIYGQVYEQDITENAGDSGNLTVEWGYGPLGTDPDIIPSAWAFLAAGYNVQSGSNDEYSVTINLPGPTGEIYSHAFRVRYNQSDVWTYCDLNGTINNMPNSDNLYELDDAGLIIIE